MKNMRIIVWLLVGIAALAGAHVLLSLNDSRNTAIVQRTSLLAVPDDAVSLISISRNGAVESVLTRTGTWRLVEPFDTISERHLTAVLAEFNSQYSAFCQKFPVASKAAFLPNAKIAEMR